MVVLDFWCVKYIKSIKNYGYKLCSALFYNVPFFWPRENGRWPKTITVETKMLIRIFLSESLFFFLLIMQSIFAIASLPADSCAWLEFVKRVPRRNTKNFDNLFTAKEEKEKKKRKEK